MLPSFLVEERVDGPGDVVLGKIVSVLTFLEEQLPAGSKFQVVEFSVGLVVPAS